MIETPTAYWDVPSPATEIIDRKRPGNTITVQLVTDMSSFAALEGEWDTLVSDSSTTIFQTFAWQFLWWKHFGSRPENHLYIVLFRGSEKLIGIAPLFIKTLSLFHFRINRKLLLLGSGLASPHSPVLSLEKQGPLDYLDIISARGSEDLVADAFIALLQNRNRLWDEVEFQNLREDGTVMTHLLLKCKDRDFSIIMEHEDTCPFVGLPDSLDKFLYSMKRSVRRNLRYVQRGFLENPEYSVEDAAANGNADGALQLLSQLHQKRWNEIGYPGLFADSRFGALIKDISKSLKQNGRLWLKVLRHEGKAIAVNLCFKFNGTMYTYASGFDRDSAAAGTSGAGSALVFQNIIDSIESRCSVIDMGRGTESYKFQFTSNTRQSWRLRLKLSEESSAAIRAYVYRIYTLWNRALSRFTCEVTIARVLIKGKGAVRGISGYISHLRVRLFAKMGSFSRSKPEGESRSTGDDNSADDERSSQKGSPHPKKGNGVEDAAETAGDK